MKNTLFQSLTKLGLTFLSFVTLFVLPLPVLRAQQPVLMNTGAGMDNYRNARTPTIKLNLGASARKGLAAKLAKLTALGAGETPVLPA